jgi:hypothetical protein
MRNEPTKGLVLKDLDFKRIKNLKKFINLHDKDWSRILKIIKSDV